VSRTKTTVRVGDVGETVGRRFSYMLFERLAAVSRYRRRGAEDSRFHPLREEDELRAAIQALGGIGTPRALQELLSALSRPNVSLTLQMEICQALKANTLEQMQSELRSAIADLKVKPRVMADGVGNLRSLAALLLPVPETSETPVVESKIASNSTGESGSTRRWPRGSRVTPNFPARCAERCAPPSFSIRTGI